MKLMIYEVCRYVTAKVSWLSLKRTHLFLKLSMEIIVFCLDSSPNFIIPTLVNSQGYVKASVTSLNIKPCKNIPCCSFLISVMLRILLLFNFTILLGVVALNSTPCKIIFFNTS